MAKASHSHHYSKAALGALVRELREAEGLLLTELAEMTGLSWQCIDDIEKGETCPRHETVMRLCDALEISWDEFHRRLHAAAIASTAQGFRREEAGAAPRQRPAAAPRAM